MNLNDLTDEQLHEELDRRKTLKDKLSKPVPVKNPDFVPVIGLCNTYVNMLHDRGHVDDDMAHYIYEAAVEAVFGKDVWPWIRDKIS